MKLILAIDGGGIKGIVPAYFVAELCQRLGQRAHDVFDFAAGTSTGGIIAIGLGMRVHHDQLVRLYRDRGEEIFRRRWLSLGGLRRPRYEADGFERLLMDQLGERPLGDAILPVGATVLRASDHRSLLWTSWDHPTLAAWQAARATSAAPTFFPPWEGYWDGGCWANNPAAVAYLRARAAWPGERIRVLSLGCGHRSQTRSVNELSTAGVMKLASHLPALLMEGGCDFVAQQMERELGPDHLRIDPDLNGASPAMDDASPEHVRDLLHVARGSVEDSMAEALSFVRAAA